MEQYLEGQTNVVNMNDAIKYLTKAIKTVTDRAVPTRTIKPSVKPKPFNAAIKAILAESKVIDWNWEKRKAF